MKKLAYVLLAVLLMQLSGLRMMCAPCTASPHDCCPSAGEHSPLKQSSLPDCCLASVLTCQGSITEVQDPSYDSHFVLVIAKTPAAGLTSVVVRGKAARRPLSHPLSPPLGPLLQTCLLLI